MPPKVAPDLREASGLHGGNNAESAEPGKHLLAADQSAHEYSARDLNGDGMMDFVATRGHGQGVLWFRGPEFTMVEIDRELRGHIVW